MERRTLIMGAATSLATATALRARPARADTWPSRPITLVVPYGPGGTSDTISRLYAEFMSEALGQQVVVENRPGAQGNIGSDSVARAAPDGYTLLMGGNFLAQNPSTGPKPRFDPSVKLKPVTLLALSPALVMVNRKSGIASLQDLLRRAAEKPDALSIGNGNIEAYVQLLLKRAKCSMRIVNYRTSPQAVTDVLAGNIDAAMSILTTVVPLLETPDLLPIAISSVKRAPLLPNVPTYAECGIKDAEIVSWFGIFAPAGLPPPILQKLDGEGQRFLAAPRTAQRFAQFGLDMPPAPDTAATFGPFVSDDAERWRKLASELGLKPE